jgi:hypothetical protein
MWYLSHWSNKDRAVDWRFNWSSKCIVILCVNLPFVFHWRHCNKNVHCREIYHLFVLSSKKTKKKNEMLICSWSLFLFLNGKQMVNLHTKFTYIWMISWIFNPPRGPCSTSVHYVFLYIRRRIPGGLYTIYLYSPQKKQKKRMKCSSAAGRSSCFLSNLK